MSTNEGQQEFICLSEPEFHSLQRCLEEVAGEVIRARYHPKSIGIPVSFMFGADTKEVSADMATSIYFHNSWLWSFYDSRRCLETKNFSHSYYHWAKMLLHEMEKDKTLDQPTQYDIYANIKATFNTTQSKIIRFPDQDKFILYIVGNLKVQYSNGIPDRSRIITNIDIMWQSNPCVLSCIKRALSQ